MPLETVLSAERPNLSPSGSLCSQILLTADTLQCLSTKTVSKNCLSNNSVSLSGVQDNILNSRKFFIFRLSSGGTSFHYFQDGQTLEKAAHRDCGVSILGHIQNPAGHSPEQSAVVNLLWAGQGGVDNPSSPHPFFDSAIHLFLMPQQIWKVMFGGSLWQVCSCFTLQHCQPTFHQGVWHTQLWSARTGWVFRNRNKETSEVNMLWFVNDLCNSHFIGSKVDFFKKQWCHMVLNVDLFVMLRYINLFLSLLWSLWCSFECGGHFSLQGNPWPEKAEAATILEKIIWGKAVDGGNYYPVSNNLLFHIN